MKETIRIELTQDLYDALSAIGVADCEIKTIGCTMSIAGPSSNHHMTVGIKTPVTSGNHAPYNIDTTPIQVESLAGGSEWNGEGLPAVGCPCIYVFNDETEYSGFVAAYHDDAVWFYCNGGHYKTFIAVNHEFKKPETEAERNERERLEAAYDLCCEYGPTCDFDSVEELRLYHPVLLNKWLRIVDKTGYRKE